MRRALAERLPRLAIAARSVVGTPGCTSLEALAPAAALGQLPSLLWRPSPALSSWPASGSLRRFSSLPPFTELAMPALSPTMSQGNIAEWKVTEGQLIAPGDLLADVETDKATMGWENQDDGYIAKLLVPAGTQAIEVGAPVALLVEEEEQVAAFKNYVPEAAAGRTSAPSSKGADSVAPTAVAHSQEETGPAIEANSRIGPAARTLLEESNIPRSSVTPSGPHHIITKGDVLAAIANGGKPAAAPSKPAPTAVPAPSPSTPPPSTPKQQQAAAPTKPSAPAAAAPQQSTSSDARYIDIPTTQIRKIIARRLLESKSTVPHLYLSADVELDAVATTRASVTTVLGKKVSVNDFVIKAAAMALAKVPAANALWDTANEAAVTVPGVDISIAVATEGGLITPIVRDADKKTIFEIAAEVRELAGRARANKLKPEEFQGGSFSISNLGMYGVDSFSAIINPPQACIMAVGGSKKVARMGPGGEPVVATVMNVTLSADNRVYDGAIASDFLREFSKIMANASSMLT